MSVNRDAQSPFLKSVNEMPETAIKPLWLDFNQDIQRGRLNHAEVLAVKNTTNDLFDLKIRFEAGRWNDLLLPIALDFVEYLGTKDKSVAQFGQEKYELASDYEFGVGNEESEISLSGLNENLGKTFALVQDLLTNCVNNEEAFKAYIAKLKKSRADAKLNKSEIARGLRTYASYGAQNPFNFVLSDEKLETLKAEDLIRVIHDLMSHKFKVLYYGPSSVEELSATLKPYLSANSGLQDFAESRKFQQIPTLKNQVLFAQYDMVQAEVFWVRNASTYNADMVPTVSLFNNYFGGGMGSVVFQTIRESKALAYSTYAYYSNASKKDRQDVQLAYVGTQADKFKDAAKGMNELLNVMPESEKGFEAAKVSLLKTLASQRVTKLGIIGSYLSVEKLGLNTDIRKIVYEQAPNLTFDNIKAFHGAELSQKPYVYCIVSNENKINMDDVKALGEFKKLSLKEVFGY